MTLPAFSYTDMCEYPKPDISSSSVPQSSIVTQKLLKTHQWATQSHWPTCSFVTWTRTHTHIDLIPHTPSGCSKYCRAPNAKNSPQFCCYTCLSNICLKSTVSSCFRKLKNMSVTNFLRSFIFGRMRLEYGSPSQASDDTQMNYLSDAWLCSVDQ